MEINVTTITKGLPGITPIAASQLYEAFEVCMHKCNHGEKAVLKLNGMTAESIDLIWTDSFNDQKERAYADMQYTVEHGAVCLSVMLSTTLTPYTIIERSRKGTGFDYWLGDGSSKLFQKKARLEVSGILKGDDATINRRYAAKEEQTRRSDNLLLPAYISVIEFSTPKAIFDKR